MSFYVLIGIGMLVQSNGLSKMTVMQHGNKLTHNYFSEDPIPTKAQAIKVKSM